MQKSKLKKQNCISKFKNFDFLIIVFSFAFYVFSFLGCATAPYVKPVAPQTVPGIYHRVEKGQTLWRISKIYALDLDEIIKINRIQDAASIEAGQLIFIPGRDKTQTTARNLPFEDFIWPLQGRVILNFGQTANNMVNKGVNIRPRKDTNVLASRSGKVIFYSPYFGSFGKTIIIDHGDGFATVYAGNSEVFVKAGNQVQKGSPIAKLSAGRNKNKDAYLHFEIRKSYIPQNPYFYLPH